MNIKRWYLRFFGKFFYIIPKETVVNRRALLGTEYKVVFPPFRAGLNFFF